MSSRWRRFEVLLPLQFNDGREVPSDWLADAVLEVVDHFGAASYETQKVEGHWRHGGILYRDDLAKIVVHLLMLMGATLITLQKLENFINGCCSLLSLKTRKGKILNISDVLSPDAKHRSETLGELKEALKMASLFDQGFELRLEEFVRERNRFVHNFWIDTVKDSTYVNPPSFETLKMIEEFVSGLLREAVQLEAPFRGLYYSFGKGLAESADTLDLMDNGLFVEWSKYEKDFLSVANVPTEPAKKPNKPAMP